MADDIVLVAETGRPTGSSASRRLRATRKVPAVLYGRGADPAALTVDWRDLPAPLTTDKGLIFPAKPDTIPGHIAVDVSDLDIGGHITVADLDLPDGVTTEVDPEEPIVTAKLTSLALAEEEEGEEGEEGEGEEGAEGEAGEGGEGGGQSAERDEGSA